MLVGMDPTAPRIPKRLHCPSQPTWGPWYWCHRVPLKSMVLPHRFYIYLESKSILSPKQTNMDVIFFNSPFVVVKIIIYLFFSPFQFFFSRLLLSISFCQNPVTLGRRTLTLLLVSFSVIFPLLPNFADLCTLEKDCGNRKKVKN